MWVKGHAVFEVRCACTLLEKVLCSTPLTECRHLLHHHDGHVVSVLFQLRCSMLQIPLPHCRQDSGCRGLLSHVPWSHSFHSYDCLWQFSHWSVWWAGNLQWHLSINGGISFDDVRVSLRLHRCSHRSNCLGHIWK